MPCLTTFQCIQNHLVENDLFQSFKFEIEPTLIFMAYVSGKKDVVPLYHIASHHASHQPFRVMQPFLL